jgi:hypothetical protein
MVSGDRPTMLIATRPKMDPGRADLSTTEPLFAGWVFSLGHGVDQKSKEAAAGRPPLSGALLDLGGQQDAHHKLHKLTLYVCKLASVA